MIYKFFVTLSEIDSYVRKAVGIQDDLEKISRHELRKNQDLIVRVIRSTQRIEVRIREIKGGLREIDVVRNEMKRRGHVVPTGIAQWIVVLSPRAYWGSRLDRAEKATSSVRQRAELLLHSVRND